MKREKLLRAFAPSLGLARIKNCLAGGFSLSLVFLLIEFYDELHYTIGGAALPSIRADLALSYAQVGLLLGLPHVVGTLIEPVMMLLSDTRLGAGTLRRALILGGGLVLLLTLTLTGSARSFAVILLAYILAFPASGAFVSLSQAALMERNPGREAQAMARWSVAGSLGNLVGPLIVAGGFALGLGWRWAFLALAGLVVALLVALALHSRFGQSSAEQSSAEQSSAEQSSAPPFPTHGRGEQENFLRSMVGGLAAALRAPGMLRWLFLLQVCNLLLDTFAEYAALYFSDVMGLSPARTSLMVGLLMGAGLAGDLVLIPLLERLPGRRVVRAAAWLALLVYPAWLLAPWQGGAALAVKAALLVAVRLSTLGWYPVLAGEMYAAAPGHKGAVLALDSLGGLLGGVLTGLIGWLAGQWGLSAAMWLLLGGPIAIVMLMPREKRE